MSEPNYVDLLDTELFSLVLKLRQEKKDASEKFSAANEMRENALMKSNECSRQYYDAWRAFSKRFE